MNYIKIDTCDLLNGEGARVVLWLSGCVHRCEGCHNPHTWNPKIGEPVTGEVIERLLELCKNHSGLTITGGDPFFPKSRKGVHEICTAFKSRYPDKNIWIWTGYTLEQLKEEPVLELIDVLIDGKYDKNKPTDLPWRGSANQRLYRLVNGTPLT